jgi:microcystin-dependent protein
MAAIAALLCALPAVTAAAQPNPVPKLVNYQGLVYLQSGSTDVTGVYDMTFRLYDEPLNGALLWAEQIADVQIHRGRFNVLLGSGAEVSSEPHPSLDVAFKTDRTYIEIQAGTDPIIRVRQQFVTTAHAFAAENAYEAIHGVPAGTIMPFAGATVPYGWVACDGASYARTGQYSALFAAIGTGWGGSGSNFNVPNLGARIPVGAGIGIAENTNGSASGMTNQPLGRLRGAEAHALTPAELPSHTHDLVDRYYGQEQDVGGGSSDDKLADNTYTTDSDTSGTTGGSTPHNTIQPSAVVRYIIKW